MRSTETRPCNYDGAQIPEGVEEEHKRASNSGDGKFAEQGWAGAGDKCDAETKYKLRSHVLTSTMRARLEASAYNSEKLTSGHC
jgi:hypothetical protein